MYRLWTFLVRFFDRRARKSSRGKAIRDEFGHSARQRAFGYFDRGLRPSQLPDLGVPKATVYRYFQSFKHRDREFRFGVTRRILRMDPELMEETARQLKVTVDELADALKKSRSSPQLRRRLGLDDAERLEALIAKRQRLELEPVVQDLRRCRTHVEMSTVLKVWAKWLGVSEAQLILALKERRKRLKRIQHH